MARINICVVGGAGYVGFITGLGLADAGHHVTNTDVDPYRICRLQAGESPIYEKGIEAVLKRNLDARRLRFTTSLPDAVASSEVVFIAVGTPSGEGGHADLSHVIQVTEELARCLDTYKVVAIRSTVPAGAVELIRSVLCLNLEEGRDFDLVINPEFLREGHGLADFLFPDRIVIGTASEKARNIMRQVYEPIIAGSAGWSGSVSKPGAPVPVPVVETDLASAQMIKYASNAFLAARVSFINEVAGLCENVGADVREVVRGMGYDPRIGHGYLEAGLGFGGPCLEKDLRSLIGLAEGNGHDPLLLRAVLERNERQVGEVAAKLRRVLGDSLNGKTVATFGLAFKAGTNDTRSSLALTVIERLGEEGAIVRAHDPVVSLDSRVLKPHVSCWSDPYQAVEGAEGLVILTEWPCFSGLDYREIKARMAAPRIVDGRNLLDPAKLRSLGFTYVGVGRP